MIFIFFLSDSHNKRDNKVDPTNKSVVPYISRHQKKKKEKLAKAFQKLATRFVKVAKQIDNLSGEFFKISALS